MSSDSEQPITAHIGGIACPHCKNRIDELIEVDRAVRWNRAEVMWRMGILILRYNTGDGDFEHHEYLCGHCEKPITLDGVEVDEDWQ